MPLPVLLCHAALILAACCAPMVPAVAQGQSHTGHYTAEPSAVQLAAADVLLVDIRQPEEWQQTGVLPQALLITHTGDHARFLAELGPHLDGRPVALICRTGNRTARAAAALAPALAVPVIDITGGMVRLMAEGTRPTAPTRARGCAVC